MNKIKVLTISALIIGAFCFGKVLNTSGFADKHPMMEAAKKNLEQAKNNLKNAAHDFGGHRIKAIALVDQAIKEIEEGIAVSDKK